MISLSFYFFATVFLYLCITWWFWNMCWKYQPDILLMSVNIDSDGGVCLSRCHIIKQNRKRQKQIYWEGKEQFIYVTVCQNPVIAKQSIWNTNRVAYRGFFASSRGLARTVYHSKNKLFIFCLILFFCWSNYNFQHWCLVYQKQILCVAI